jgi:lipopolysaccharide/colanic/teichoic acid biosynthesis glycosyltransferase
MRSPLRHVPVVRNVKLRTAVGFALLLFSFLSAQTVLGKGRIGVIVPVAVSTWLVAVFLTEKYDHKYPQRYLTYLAASHMKAAILMAVLLFVMGWVAGPYSVPRDVLWSGFLCFVVVDALVSVLRRRDIPAAKSSVAVPAPAAENGSVARSGDSGSTDTGSSPADGLPLDAQIRSVLDKPFVEFMEKHLPDLKGVGGEVRVLEEIPDADATPASAPVRLLVSRVRLNDVRRLNRFFLHCVERIAMGGYIVSRYVPLENDAMDRKRRYTGALYRVAFLLHFVWYRAFPKIPWLNALYFSITKGRNRVLSKVEVWGRLSYCGMKVVAESEGDGERYLIAQREATPVRNRKPTYYPVVSLEKVGLDGEIFHTHKIRTMFPFSEFLQKRIFEDHGLRSTGKFMNDYRLTEYGNLLRKYWIDELPGIFDWLRGDIKLVGLRATSRHYLGLYPKHFHDLYIQTKPGLVPPIFDETTSGFDQIVKVDLAYLESYREEPFKTDVRILLQTFTDIVFRGIRSH